MPDIPEIKRGGPRRAGHPRNQTPAGAAHPGLQGFHPWLLTAAPPGLNEMTPAARPASAYFSPFSAASPVWAALPPQHGQPVNFASPASMHTTLPLSVPT